MANSRMSFFLTNSSYHVVIHAGSIIFAFITQVIASLFFTLAKEGRVPNALFQTSLRNVSDTFHLEVTMDWWSVNFWHLIDVWSMAWLAYAVVSTCRRNVLGPESCNPEIHPPVFYLMWAIINISRMCSMLLLDRHYIIGAVLFRWILPVDSFYMLYMSSFSLNKHKAWLAINNPSVISWTQYLVMLFIYRDFIVMRSNIQKQLGKSDGAEIKTQNGLAMFAWWSLLDAAVALGVVLKYNNKVPDPLVSTITLSIISLCIFTWFILQSLLLTKYMRHTYSVYATLILGLGAMLTSSYRVRDLSVNTAICGILMLMTTTMSFIHLISACLYTRKSHKPLAVEPHLKFDGCETVCQLEGNMKHKLQK